MNQSNDTIDTRFMSREFLTHFILIYKEHTALWKVKSSEYSNRQLKAKGYEALVQYCQNVYPTANRDFVTKKIQNMRGSFRKELKKINDYARRGHSYEPRLWYFDLLFFTHDQELDDKDKDGDKESNKGEEGSEDEREDVNTEKTYSEDENVPGGSEYNMPPATMNYVTVRKKLKRKTQIAPKSKKRRQSEQQHEILKICAAALSQKDTIDEFDAVSVNVAAKLKKMEPLQQILAEGLINKVLQMGLLKELSKTTDVTDYTSTSY